VTEETIAKDSPSGYQPATKVATSVAVRPILKGVVYAIARPELKLYMQPEQTAKVAQQISVLLSEVIGVSGGTVERINEYELCGYFLDPADMVVGLPSIWKQFRSAVLRIENVESCTLTLSGHVGTVYVEEFAKGDRRTFKTAGETVNLTRQIGKYIPDNRIWVTQSALSYAQKKGVGNSFHQVSGQLPEAPGEQIFEWRPAVAATTEKESPKPKNSRPAWVSSVGDLAKSGAQKLGKLVLKAGIACLIAFGLWLLARMFLAREMRILKIPVPGDAKPASNGQPGKTPQKKIPTAGKDSSQKSGAGGNSGKDKGSRQGTKIRKGVEKPKQGVLKKETQFGDQAPPPSNGPAGNKGPSTEENSTTGAPSNGAGENPAPPTANTPGIGPGKDEPPTSGGSAGDDGKGGNSGVGTSNAGGTTAGGATNSGGTTGSNGTSGTGSG
jgi:hypothetical protein